MNGPFCTDLSSEFFRVTPAAVGEVPQDPVKAVNLMAALPVTE
jgi:hypothetical protein